MDSVLIFLGTGSIVCLIPLSVYLLYLAHLNGRKPPAVIRGDWDFTALLLGLSGFLFVSGPILLTLADSTYRSIAFGGWADFKRLGNREARFASLMGLGYFLIVIGTCWGLLRSRRNLTSIYNVDATRLHEILTETLNDLQYPWQLDRGVYVIGIRKILEGSPQRLNPSELATLSIDDFAATFHALLRWNGPFESIRTDIENTLSNRLTGAIPPRNPLASWLFGITVLIAILLAMWIVMLILIVWHPM